MTAVTVPSATIRNLGWRVTAAGVGINLALGVLYSWSVVKGAIPAEWGWSDFEKTLPYSLCCLVFALTMVPAGRAQDRFGPRWVALIGGIAVGAGMILASFTSSVAGFVVGFGVLAGIGIGMGYATATPAAVKWFPPKRTGLIAGLVVAGFGLSSVYIAPLANYLINTFSAGANKGPGVQMTMLILGIAFLIVVGALAQLLAVPPAGWKPVSAASAGGAAPAKKSVDYSWTQMLQTPQFYMLWVMYACAAGAGLMIIASLASIVKLQAGIQGGFLFVAILAVGNAGGRVVAGVLSDKIGRRATLMVFFLIQAAIMFSLRHVSQQAVFVIVSMLLGANYGANLALFPAVTKDYYGLKNFGVNYGWVFTAWGVGGLALSQVAGYVYDASKKADAARRIANGMSAVDAVGNYHAAYLIAGSCLLLAAAIALVLRAPAVAHDSAPAASAAQAVPARGAATQAGVRA